MVNKSRFLIVAASSAALLVASAAPALGAFTAANPDPLREEQLVRLLDVATTQNAKEQPAVAIGWREGPNPGTLFMTFSNDGGANYLRNNDNMRQWAVAGHGNLGLTLDVCGDDVWSGSAANFPGDRARDTDVLVTRRSIGGAAAQVFVTAPSSKRKVRDVSVSCVGNKFLAIAWLEQSGGKTKARLMLRDLESLAPAATNKTFFLGGARFGGGISIAATAKSVHVAWSAGQSANVRYRRFLVGKQADPVITSKPAITLASKDAARPQLAIQGQKVVAVYTDQGKVVVRLSKNLGKEFGAPRNLIGSGTVKKPSRAHSVDIFGQRIVIEATKRAAGKSTAQRHTSTNLGNTWGARSFGHNGTRMGALRKIGPGASSLAESWLDNGPSKDTLRAQYETP